MKYEVKKLEKSAVEVKLHLDAAEVSPLVDKVLKHVGEHAEVAGFRKGHVPKEALMANYKDHIESDVANDAINTHFPEIVEKEKLEPVSYVRLKEIALKDDLDLTFDIDVYPEFTLGNYKGLEAEKKTFEMTDDLLNTELEMMQRNHSKLVEVEDASYKAQLEDTVDLAFEGFMDGVPFPGGKAESHLLKLGSKSFIDNFEDQLVGYTKGQEGEITVKFPEEYHAPELAGKPAQFKVKRTYERYKKVRTKSGLTGKEVAEIIMQANGITGVRVVRGEVELSDHYDPTNNVVVLSPIVHDQPTVASVAIAAHEIGHVIQDKVADYKPMRWRHSLVPLANLGGNLSTILIMVGFLLTGLIGQFGYTVAWVGVGFMLFAVLFQVVTLPVEFDASKRALEQVVDLNIVDDQEHRHCRKVLTAAALTYVAAAMVALMELLRFIFILLNSSNRD